MVNLKERYANALLELSEEKDTLEKDLDQAILIRDTLKSADVQSFLVHPNISNSAKEKLFHNTFSEILDEHFMGFLYLVVRKNRESLIVPVLTEYINSINRRLGRIVANVVSAKELTEKQVESIQVILSKKTDMQVEVKATVDPDVIGGFYILVDGRIFDGTVRSKLNIMKERLKERKI